MYTTTENIEITENHKRNRKKISEQQLLAYKLLYQMQTMLNDDKVLSTSTEWLLFLYVPCFSYVIIRQDLGY